MSREQSLDQILNFLLFFLPNTGKYLDVSSPNG